MRLNLSQSFARNFEFPPLENISHDFCADFQLSQQSAKAMQFLSISDVKTLQLSATVIPHPLFVVVGVLELQICDRTVRWLETTVFKKSFSETEAVLILQQSTRGKIKKRKNHRKRAVYTWQNCQPCSVKGYPNRITRQACILPSILKSYIPYIENLNFFVRGVNTGSLKKNRRGKQEKKLDIERILVDRELEPQGCRGRDAKLLPHPQSLVQKAFTNRSQLTSESNQHPSPDLNSPAKHACNQTTWKNYPTKLFFSPFLIAES